MSRKIQFHTFQLLFRLFCYLADKTGGWSMFVRPKLMIGALIVGMGVTGSNAKTTDITQQSNKVNNLTKNQINTDPSKDTPMIISCYDSTEPYTYCDKNGIYINAEQMPEFPNGIEKLQAFIQKRMIYPQEALEKKIEGVVICSFIVRKDGAIFDVKVLRSIYVLLDNEAIRIIKSFPRWNPGKHNGVIVPVRYTLPIRFTLPSKKK